MKLQSRPRFKWTADLRLTVALSLCWAMPHFAQGAAFSFNSSFQPDANPVGPWEVRVVSGKATTTVQTTDLWGTPQASLGNTPGVFKSNGTELFPHDWQSRDMVAKTSPFGGDVILIVWTPPEACLQVNYSVSLWAGTPSGPTPWFQINVSPWGVAEFGNLSELGTFDRAHPFQISGSLGPLDVGNEVSLLLERGRNGPLEGYVGFTFAIEATPIPEPEGFIPFVGLTLLATHQVIRRRNR